VLPCVLPPAIKLKLEFDLGQQGKELTLLEKEQEALDCTSNNKFTKTLMIGKCLKAIVREEKQEVKS